MKRAIFGIAALALGLAPVVTQAHGPGAGQLFPQNGPVGGTVHTHCTDAVPAQEFFVTAHVPGETDSRGTSVGVGKGVQDPTRTDWYFIVPLAPPGAQIHNHPQPNNTNPCGDSIVP
jgi:hypothetical protein